MHPYSPPTKFLEGNIFTGVCLSFCSIAGGPHVTINNDALDLTIENPIPPLQLVTSDGWFVILKYW